MRIAARVLVDDLAQSGYVPRAQGYTRMSALLVDAGHACGKHHDKTMRGTRSKRIQADDIWCFCYEGEECSDG
jgi:hypothetical protein